MVQVGTMGERAHVKGGWLGGVNLMLGQDTESLPDSLLIIFPSWLPLNPPCTEQHHHLLGHVQ